MAIDTCVLAQKDYIVGMRRYFHAHPEVSLNSKHRLALRKNLTRSASSTPVWVKRASMLV